MTTFFDLMKNIVNTLNAVVRIDSQTLTDEEKATVLNNISAASQDDFVVVKTEVANMKADMEYIPIKITEISNDLHDTVEIGTDISEMTVTWKLNKDPIEQTLGGYKFKVPNDDRESLVPMTGRTSVELVVTDERYNTDSATTGYNAYNGVYYGEAETPETIDDAFIKRLSYDLLDSKIPAITVNAKENQRIWYALPVRLGTCKFSVDGVYGGFELVDTIDYTNRSNYMEPYYVYASVKSGLGLTKVVISDGD